MKQKQYASIAAAIALLTCGNANAQIIVTTGQTATQLAQRLTGDGVTVTNATLTCASGGSGRFIAPSGSLNIDSGIVLTTGYATTGGSNIGVSGAASLQASADRFVAGDPTLSAAIGGQTTQDACKLEFDFMPQGDTIKFQYKFGSEEYPEYACSSFNDAFGFFITGPGISGAQNIALVPNTNIPVTINTVNPGAGANGQLSTCTAIGPGVPFAQYYVNNGSSTTLTYDGITTLLTARRAVTPCTTYHLKLAIADVGDGTYDSGVFLKAGSLTSEAAGVTPVAMATALTQPYLVRGCLAGAFNVSRPTAQPTPLTVRYHIAGTAVNGVDYTFIPDSVVIPAGAATAQRPIAPLVTGAPTGPRTVKIKILAPGCQNTIVYVDSAQLTIYDSLQAKILTPDTLLCPGATLPITVAGDAGLTYSWSPAAGLNSATVQSPVASPAITTTYLMTASLAGSTCPPVSDTVIVRRLPSISISGPLAVCEGATHTWSATTNADIAGYAWTIPPGWTGTSTTSSINVTAGATGGNIIVSPVSACGTTAGASIAVAVTPLPTVGGVTGATTPCVGSTQTYSVTGSGGTSYTWTLPGAGWSGTSASSSLSATVGTATGNVSVTATNSCGSSAASVLNVIPVAAPAGAGPVSGPAALCVAASGTYSIPAVPGATTYTWTLPAGWSGSSTSTSIVATAGNTGGNISVSASNACGSTMATLPVSITQPATPGAISGPQAVCAGGTQTYSVALVPGATFYTWTLPPGWTGASSSSSITVGTSASVGTITVTSTSACGTSATSTLMVTSGGAAPQPGPINGATAVCSGVAQTYNIAAVAGATSYTWTLPGGWSGTSSTPSISAIPAGTGGVITVVANASCGASSQQMLNVTSVDIPAQPTPIAGTVAVCNGVAQTYSVPALPGSTSYAWTLPAGWGGTSSTASIATTPTGNGGIISVTASNYCGTSTPASLTVSSTSIPAPPTTVSGTTAVCSGASQTYSTSPSAGATSYTWTLPGGWSGTSSTSSISATPSGMGGTISVSASNYCGVSAPVMLSVTAASIPAQPSTISGATAVCNGIAQTYSITPVAGATSYSWSLPPGWSGNSSGPTITATPGNTGGTISVTAVNYCGTSGAQALSVNSASAPNSPGAITGLAVVCSGVQQSFNIAPVAGAVSYIWTLPGGWIGASSGSSITTIPSSTSGTVSVSAVSNCGASLPSTISVSAAATPVQPGAIAGPAAPCVGTSQTYSVAAVGGAASYTWTLPGAGWTGTSTGTSIFTQIGNAGGTVTVTATNYCGTSTASVITVAPVSTPAQPVAVLGSATPCVGAASVYSVAGVSGATSYSWTLPAGWSGASSSSSISATPTSAGGTISVTAVNACGSSASQLFSVSPMTVPVQPGAIATPPSLCQAASGVYSVAPVTGATSYTWTLPPGWSGSSTTSGITVTAGTSGTVIVTANNVCGASVPSTAFVLVAPLPTMSGSIFGASQLCIGAPVVFTAPAASNAISYVWTLPSNLSGSSTTSNISATPTAAGSVLVSVVAVNGCGSSAPVSMPVTVNPTTATGVYVSASFPNGGVCPGVPATFTAISTGGGVAPTYTWTRNGSIQAGITGMSFTIQNPQNGDVVGVQMASGAACPMPATAVSAPLTISLLPAVVPGININTQYSNVPTICAATQLNFTANIAGGGSLPVYSWRKNGIVVGTNSPTYSASGWANGDTVWAVLTSNAQCATPAIQPSNKIGVMVGVPFTPTVNISVSPGTSYVPGQQFTFTTTATGTGPTPSFQWMRNSQNILGAFGPTYVTSALTGGDTISVRLSSNDPCAATSTVFSNKIVMTSSTAVHEMRDGLRLGLYPNPNDGAFVLHVAGGRRGERIGIDVLNALGQAVWKRELVVEQPGWMLPMALKDMAAGIYLLRLLSEDAGMTTVRFELRK